MRCKLLSFVLVVLVTPAMAGVDKPRPGATPQVGDTWTQAQINHLVKRHIFKAGLRE